MPTQTLAASAELATNNMAEFHRLARDVIASNRAGMNVVVSDEGGRQLSGTKPLRAYMESHMSAQHLAVVGKIKLPAPVRKASGKAK